MSRTIVFTDLDGTLLEDDGTLSPDAREALGALRERDVPVVPLTSKTRRELERWLEVLDTGGAGAFENGAGILRKGRMEILPAARSVGELRTVLEALRRSTGLPLFSFEEIPDAAMANLTGLGRGEAAAAREREFDLPFVAPADAADLLARVTLPRPDIRLVRGGRFWHLSGAHDKADALRLLVAWLGGGETVGLGDAPSDAGFLRIVDRAVLVPGRDGVDARLAASVPGAATAPAPAGAGWAAAVRSLGLAGAGRP